MRIGLAGGAIAVLVVIAIILGYGTLFTVSQTQQALVVRLGGTGRSVSGKYGTTPGPLWPVSMIVLLVSLRMRSIVSRYMRSRVTDGAFLY